MKPVVFGEVLWDRFPDGRAVLGGAPFNVAWNLQALGAAPRFVSRVGRDELGERIAAAMAVRGLDATGLQTDPAHATGTVEVAFDGGEPSYTIAADRAWDHIAPPADMPGGGLLYHGSLAVRSPGSRAALEVLRGRADAVFVDVNLRDPWWDPATVLDLLAGARWAKLNADELAALVPGEPDNDRRAARLLADAGLERVIVTMGADGAAVHGPDGPPLIRGVGTAGAVVDTVGAGDAFSAVTLLGLLRGWPWDQILDRAQQLAAAVVGLRGATSDDPEFYEPFATAWERT
jgi:fructokinase